MITVSDVTLQFADRKLFESVNIKFTPGNCYGIIGANGAGKTTFLKVLSGEIDSTSGQIIIPKGLRLSTLKQNHYEFNEISVLETVIMGYKELYSIMKEKDAIYEKTDFTEEDGYKAADLEMKFAELDGWEAESDAEKLLAGLKLENNDSSKLMGEISASDKVKVLLAQALFGNPDILLLDEPTNHLDFYAIKWLESFIENYDKTVIVVSHDRHFLNNVCTHIVDIDFQEARLFVGNYDFWKQSSELMSRLVNDVNKKKEEQIKELQDFVARFSANASKSKQATSRKKLLEKITLDDIKPSLRKYPFIQLNIDRPLGKDVVNVENLCQRDGSNVLFKDVSFIISQDEKVAIISKDEKLVTELFEILGNEKEYESGSIKWGITAVADYFPKDNTKFFVDPKVTLIDWLRAYSGEEQGEAYIRSFLGKMLFSHDEPLKRVNVLSGGEKMRMMFSKLMLSNSNTIILDQPTNHLDLESISSVNEALINFKGALLYSSHDFTLLESIANKIIEITPNGAYEFNGNFNEFLDNEKAQETIKKMYEN